MSMSGVSRATAWCVSTGRIDLASLGYSVVDILGRDVSDENAFARSAGLQEVWDYVAIPTEEPEASGMIGRVLAGDTLK